MNKQMAAWHLRSEPFLFAIDREGKVVDRLEGAFSVAELRGRRATRAAVGGCAGRDRCRAS